MHMIRIKSSLHDYDVTFGRAGEFLAKLAVSKNTVFVVDCNVWRLYRAALARFVDPSSAIVLQISEERKCLKSVQLLYDNLIQLSAKRNITLVSLGGGILQDISGFAASTIYRGVRWIYFPTTLLSQSDSCIGAKTSLNYRGYKNLIGTFYPPSKVFIDTAFLATQKEVDFFSGVGEVVKLHLMGGSRDTRCITKELDRFISRDARTLEKLVVRALKIKQDYIEGDEFDSGRRNLLNFGHCFGHALEAASAFRIPHGQAVVAGMLFADTIAEKRKLLGEELKSAIDNELLLKSLKVRLEPAFMKPRTLVSYMKKDKKRTGKGLPLVMLTDGYRMTKIDDLGEAEVAWGIGKLMDLVKTVKLTELKHA